jgi:hypothetical protein
MRTRNAHTAHLCRAQGAKASSRRDRRDRLASFGGLELNAASLLALSLAGVAVVLASVHLVLRVLR